MIGSSQNVNIPDVNFKAYLVSNTAINTNGDAEIQVSEAVSFNGEIECSWMNIYDLTGIEAFTSLTELQCNNNQLSTLDVSQNTALTNLRCYANQLTSLDVSSSPNLEYLICYNNQLTNLNVSNNSILHHLYCFGNLITSLDVSNVPCSNWQEPVFNDVSGGWGTVIDNPNLFCIQVDNAICWDSLYTWSIDTTYQYYSNNCSGTSINEQTRNKELIKVIDLLGKETKQTNQPLFYIYDDGTVEKRIVIE